MAGNDYRRGRKQVNVLLSLALHGQVRSAAAAAGVSVNDWLVDAIREKVSRDAGADHQGVGRDAGADRGISGPVEGGDRPDHARVGAGDGSHPLVGAVMVPLWAQEALSAGATVRHLAAVPDTATLDPDEWLDLP